jgi:hypothetical protein
LHAQKCPPRARGPCADNAINGTDSCANSYTLGQIHRWCGERADGSALGCTVGTDWGALRGNSPEGAARALNAGVDLEMGSRCAHRGPFARARRAVPCGPPPPPRPPPPPVS